MRCEKDGVIERGAAWASGRTWTRTLRGNGASGAGYCRAVHLGFVERMFEPADRTGEILLKLDIGAEADDKRLVLGAQRALEEGTSDFFFHIQDAQLAIAGIDENAESQREIGFGPEIFNGLELAVFEQVEVVLGKIRNQRSMFVLHVKKQLDDFDVYLQGLDRLVLRLVVRSGTGVGSGIRIGRSTGRSYGRE